MNTFENQEPTLPILVVELQGPNRRAEFIELLTCALVLVNAQRVNHIDRAVQIRFAPHDLLLTNTG